MVDDEADARELIRAVLENCGTEVTTASSADEALEVFEKTNPDVLISDIGMPDVDGYVLINKIRELQASAGKKIPAVALTAYAGADDRARALTAGFQVHVPKPIEPIELIAVLASLADTDK